MTALPSRPYGLLVWASCVDDDASDSVTIWDSPLHNPDECPYRANGMNYFDFSGPALFISKHVGEIAQVTLTRGHASRRGFFIALSGHRPTEYPVLITDALQTERGPVGVLHFAPADPTTEWADIRIDASPIYYGVFSQGWFGVIQFTSLETGLLHTFWVEGQRPVPGQQVYFSHEHDLVGTVVSFHELNA